MNIYYRFRQSILVNVNLIKENKFRFIFHFNHFYSLHSLSKGLFTHRGALKPLNWYQKRHSNSMTWWKVNAPSELGKRSLIMLNIVKISCCFFQWCISYCFYIETYYQLFIMFVIFAMYIITLILSTGSYSQRSNLNAWHFRCVSVCDLVTKFWCNPFSTKQSSSMWSTYFECKQLE